MSNIGDGYMEDEDIEKLIDAQFVKWIKQDEEDYCSGNCTSNHRDTPGDCRGHCPTKEEKCTCDKDTIVNKGCQCKAGKKELEKERNKKEKEKI